MDYLKISDYLWYLGHILSGISIIFTQINYNIAVFLVIFGQFITIISRPIGRIKNEEKTKSINDIGIIVTI